MPELRIEPATAADLPEVIRLLEEAKLPTEGVETAFPEGYVLVRSGGALVACAGLERHGNDGLLRSVVVAPAHRSKGLARALVDDRLRWAAERGLGDVYLLTTTASDYFARLGFLRIARESAPADVRASGEFASVCPASATCMVLQRH